MALALHFLQAMSRIVQIIVTPGSGEGRALHTARRLEEILNQRGDEVGLRTYRSLAALTKWAKTCEADFTHLVCVGGDATLSATAAASVRLSRPFLPVPSGFGNIFARSFGHPRQPEEVADLLDKGETWLVDVGMTQNEEIFLSHRSHGFLQDIQETVERGRAQPRSRVGRYLAYWSVVGQFLADPRCPALAVEIDGQRVTDAAGLVTVANVETYRGFLSLTPTASPVDGLFDVFIVPCAAKVWVGARLLRLMMKLPGRWNGVRLYQGRRVVVGHGQRREELTVAHRSLPLIVPPGAVARLTERSREATAPIEQTKEAA
jgi:diacylglycerol kinase (ATP)